MRKLSLMFLMLIMICCMFFCNACKSYYYTYEELNEGLIGVEIINLSDEQDVETLKVLNSDETKKCLEVLSTIEIYEISPLSSPIKVQGKCIKLNYGTTSLIISGYGICDYSKENGCSLGWKLADKEKIEDLIIMIYTT